MKKLISLTICFVMCITVICATTVSADNECGDEVVWNFENGILTISGNGAMYDYDAESDVPWYSIRNQVKKIVVSDGVSYIGNMAFYGCINAKTASLADSVVGMGLNSFSYTEGFATNISNVNSKYMFSINCNKSQVKAGETFYMTIELKADYKNIAVIQSNLVFDDERITIDTNDWCDKEWEATIDDTNIGYISKPSAGVVNNALRLGYISINGYKIDEKSPLYDAGITSIDIAKVKCKALVDLSNIDISCFYLKDCKVLVAENESIVPDCSVTQLTSSTILPLNIKLETTNSEILDYKGDKTIGAETTASANDVITVYIDGKKLDFDVDPILYNDRTLVPMRAIFEYLDAKVFWDDETSTAFGSKDDVTVCFQIDNTIMTKNNDVITLDVPAQLVNDRTLVPLRAISEALGCTVDWVEATQSVIITTK